MESAMRKKIILTSKFNIMTGERNRCYSRNEWARTNRDWLENRLAIFENFTLKCLKKQSVQDFTAVYAIEDSSEEVINEILQQYGPLPSNVMFVKKSEYTNVITSLCQGYDMLYLTRLDSDDMYPQEFVKTLHNFPIKENTQELLCQEGFIYHSPSNQLAEYYHQMFTYYTFIYRLYKEDTRFSSLPITPMDLLVNFPHGATMNYVYETIPGRQFIFHIHGTNTDSTFGVYDWGFAKVGKMIDDPIVKNNILACFFQ